MIVNLNGDIPSCTDQVEHFPRTAASYPTIYYFSQGKILIGKIHAKTPTRGDTAGRRPDLGQARLGQARPSKLAAFLRTDPSCSS